MSFAAVISKGEIIVRDNPGQSLEGLNRAPSQALKTEQTANVSIDWKPVFSYADTFLDGWGVPAGLKGTIDLIVDPKAFFNDLQDSLARNIPLLKRPEQKKENPTSPTDQTPSSLPASPPSGPQATEQY